MRIMIVDDEVIIRTGLAKVIRWHELGLELLEPAASAEEALERIPQERPNILLTDIRMTGKTGLQLAEEAKAMLPDTEVIILSGYDDFVYTQQAIRQGVSDYLLKTSRPEEIIKTVLRAKRRIEDKWAARNEDQAKQKAARSRMLERLLSGETDEADMERLPAYLPSLYPEVGSGEAGRYQIALIHADGWGESASMSALLLFAVENMLGELLRCETLIQKKRVAVAVRLDSQEELALAGLLPKIEELLKCTVFAAVGVPVERLAQCRESYETAEEAFAYKGLLGKRICLYEEIRQRKGGKTVCTHEEELELSAILLDNDLVALKNWVQRYIGAQLDDPQTTIESLEASAHSAALSAHRWLERALSATGRGMPPELSAPHLSLKEGGLPKDALFIYLRAVMSLYHQRLAEGPAAHVQKAMAYIEQHLGSDVGLQQVARHVHLHPNHLSEVFKKETGTTFGDYVTRRKLSRAMEILSVSPAKISEVAAKVGYEDVKYFGQLFKKFTGKTPSEFREEAAVTGGPAAGGMEE